MANNFAAAWMDDFSGSRAWAVVQLLGGIGLGAKTWYEWANGATANSVFAWMVALMVYAVGVVAFHAWGAWSTEHASREGYEKRLRAIEDVTPRIEFDRVAHTDVQLGPGAGSTLDVWELWFRNRPSVQAVRATATPMTAEILFCGEHWRELLNPFVGQWAMTTMPHHVGWTSLESKHRTPGHLYVGEAAATRADKLGR